MSTEEWRDIPGWEGLYKASTFGNIASYDRLVRQKNGVNRKSKGRNLSMRSVDSGGYNVVNLYDKEGNRTNVRVHVLVALTYLGERPIGCFICHNDGNSLNNSPDNLRYGTPSDNMYDKVDHGNHWQTHKARCPRGHLLVEPNLVEHKLRQGWRSCKSCVKAQMEHRRRPHLHPPVGTASHEIYDKIMAGQPDK